MEVLVERCAGIDLSKADAKVCVRINSPGKRVRREVRTFSTMSDGLLELRDWLLENGVTRVGMEATASYWKPLYYLLEATEGIEPWLLNAQHIKTVPAARPTSRTVSGSADWSSTVWSARALSRPGIFGS